MFDVVVQRRSTLSGKNSNRFVFCISRHSLFRHFIVQEKLISMIMAMFAFVGDRLVRKDDLYSYQVMEKTIKTVIPSLYKVRTFSSSVAQRRFETLGSKF